MPRSDGFNPFGDLLGLQFTRCQEGNSQCVLEVKEKLLNPHKVLHGGVLYTMADTGMGAALIPSLAEDELSATVEIKIVYLLPVRSGTITCETKLVHKAKTMAVLESEIKGPDGLAAKALGTYSIFKVRKAGP